jgi:hypothetical protein
MQKTLLGLAAALGLAATGLSPASAQVVPSGSYQQSCTNIHVRGDQLIARCNAPQGGTVRSTFTLGTCRNGDIANMNGQLTCNRNGNGRYRGNGYGYGNGNGNGNGNGYGYGNGNGNYAGIPGGSYQQSCTNARVNGVMLSANCPSANGTRITSTINTNRCRGLDILNDNGRLECR